MEPKIRFKGFEEEWKAPLFSEMVERISASGQAGMLPGVEFEDIASGEGCFNKNIYQKECHKYGKLFYEGDILFGKLRPYLKNIILADFNGVAIGDFWVLRSKGLDEKYLYTLVNSESFLKVANISSGSKMPRADWNLISTTKFVVPSAKDEQKAIGKYFTSLDSQISASTSRLASLKQMKAASLQAMFPQEGETVPKIRFKGFEGEWKTCVLSSIATMHARIGWQNLRKDEFLSSGDYYLITGTDFHDGKISFETCHYIDKERYNQDKNIQLETDSILITKDGTLGKVAFVDSLNKPATLNAGVFNVRTKDKEIYPKYLFQYLKAPYLMDYVNKNATGGTIKHLNQNMLVNFPVQHPSYKEQVMIGDYLFNLDRQISLQSQRLEKLKQIKSACLDKMFV